MNLAAADPASWRSVAYVAAPVFLAVITDRVIAEIRQHVLPLDAAPVPGTTRARRVRGGTLPRHDHQIPEYGSRRPSENTDAVEADGRMRIRAPVLP
jgi:hypothetical protein